MKRYCPACKTKKLMVKAGFVYGKYGKKQRWLCTNKRCRRTTVYPLQSREE